MSKKTSQVHVQMDREFVDELKKAVKKLHYGTVSAWVRENARDVIEKAKEEHKN